MSLFQPTLHTVPGSTASSVNKPLHHSSCMTSYLHERCAYTNSQLHIAQIINSQQHSFHLLLEQSTSSSFLSGSASQPNNIYSSCYIYHGIITYFGSLQQGTHTSVSVHFYLKHRSTQRQNERVLSALNVKMKKCCFHS